MAFAGGQSSSNSYGAPLLITSSTAISVPEKATRLLAYIVSGGGSGGATFLPSGQGQSAGGGAGCGVFIDIDLVSYRKVGSAISLSTPLVVTNTIGAGGIAVSGFGVSGNAGGSTTLALTGGLSIVATGGAGGPSGSLGGVTGGIAGTCAAAVSYFQADYARVQKLSLPAVSGADVGGAGGNANAVTSGSETAAAGGSGPVIFFPWWLQAFGLSVLGAGGSGAVVVSGQKAAGGGGGGINGSGGNGVVSNSTSATGGAGTGYGSGGGGAVGVGAATSGAGAGGCSVIVFKMGA